ncbi:MAG: prephenate dehydrogenase [Planctomycetota bacterium]|jgi:prephenate dehydrogenase
MKELRHITVIGLGLLGGSITLTIKRSFTKSNVIGYTHRQVTRQKAMNLAVADEIFDSLTDSVKNTNLVILATPISTFENIFKKIAPHLSRGCIVTDVGSTKTLPTKWATKYLPQNIHYIGSHPIAGSEQRGIEFSRDDLFERTACIITKTKSTNTTAFKILKQFWEKLGCIVQTMTPLQHDKVFAKISHLPHIVASALINANDPQTLKFAGTGFIDTSRVASGPPNIWTDILLTNAKNCTKAIDEIIKELNKLKKAIRNENKKQIEELLQAAKSKRTTLINYKMKKKELL